jgi:hypothetical protein
LPHGLQVNWRRPSLRLYRRANAASHRDDIGALVEATDVFDVLDIKASGAASATSGAISKRSAATRTPRSKPPSEATAQSSAA